MFIQVENENESCNDMFIDKVVIIHAWKGKSKSNKNLLKDRWITIHIYQDTKNGAVSQTGLVTQLQYLLKSKS